MKEKSLLKTVQLKELDISDLMPEYKDRTFSEEELRELEEYIEKEEVYELLDLEEEELKEIEGVNLKASKEIDSSKKVEEVFSSMTNLIKVKNSRYGNSVMEPLGIFNKHVKADNDESLNGILVRIDDKLKRIKNSDLLRKNDVSDLIGYLAFLCANKGWTNFDDLID
jgi:hypothetical protein